MLSRGKKQQEMIGRHVRKSFGNQGIFDGTVKSYKQPYFMIHYDDDDREELTFSELQTVLIPEDTDTKEIDVKTVKTKRSSMSSKNVSARLTENNLAEHKALTQQSVRYAL